MNKQWIYRNGETPFSVTEIVMPDGEVRYVSVTLDECLIPHYPNGGVKELFSNKYDLIPYEPYADFKMDDEVKGWDHDDGLITSGHFAGLTLDGKPTMFALGGTSFTRYYHQRIAFNFCEKAAPKEDATNV
jgi:hypothetical protein